MRVTYLPILSLICLGAMAAADPVVHASRRRPHRAPGLSRQPDTPAGRTARYVQGRPALLSPARRQPHPRRERAGLAAFRSPLQPHSLVTVVVGGAVPAPE